jgi:excisionase family DNA binding protein
MKPGEPRRPEDDPMPNPDTYLTVAEAAELLHVSRAHIYQLVKDGKLGARRRVPAVSLVSRADVEARLRARAEADGAA